LRKKIDNMSGLEFEDYLYYVFLNLGYEVEKTPYSVDFGADLIIIKNKIKTVVQAKRYSGPIGVSAVQEVLGSRGYYNAKEALVVTNSRFTANARELAKKNNVKLWDRAVLFGYLITDDELIGLKRKERKQLRKRNKKRNNFKKNIDIIVETVFKHKI